MGAWMHKAECLGVQSLTRADLETVVDEGLVGSAALSAQNLRSAVTLVAEERVSDVLHVSTYLMCASRLKYTLHKGGIAEALQYSVMSDGRLANARFRIEDLHAQPVFRIASDVALYAPLVFDEVSPNECVVGAVSRSASHRPCRMPKDSAADARQLFGRQ